MNHRFPLRPASLAALLLAATGNSGCTSGADSDTDVSQTGGTGGTTGSTSATDTSAACDSPDATTFAEITAPDGAGFSEVAIAATPDEVAVAGVVWPEDRNVTISLRRFSPDGAPIGDTLTLGEFNGDAGQLASGGFYGHVRMATDGERIMVCWGEANQIGCASVAHGATTASVASIAPPSGNLVKAPTITFGPSGWWLFYLQNGKDGQAVELAEDASPKGAPVDVPGTIAVATEGGFATIAELTHQVYRLGPDLSIVGIPVPVEGPYDGIAASGAALSVVGGGRETRIDGVNQPAVTDLGPNAFVQMAVTARKDAFAVVWTSYEEALRLRVMPISGADGPDLHVGCSPEGVLPAIAATETDYLIAALRPEDSQPGFYNMVSPKIRVARVKAP